MEVYNINPIYKNLINSRGVKTSFKEKKHKNNWIKALISIFVLALLMMSVGVPVYDGLLAIENNAVPYEFGNMGNLNVKTTSTLGTSEMGNIIWYEIEYGHVPTANELHTLLIGILAGYGIGGAITILIEAIIAAFTVGSSISAAVSNVLLGLVSPEAEGGILTAILAA